MDHRPVGRGYWRSLRCPVMGSQYPRLVRCIAQKRPFDRIGSSSWTVLSVRSALSPTLPSATNCLPGMMKRRRACAVGGPRLACRFASWRPGANRAARTSPPFLGAWVLLALVASEARRWQLRVRCCLPSVNPCTLRWWVRFAPGDLVSIGWSGLLGTRAAAIRHSCDHLNKETLPSWLAGTLGVLALARSVHGGRLGMFAALWFAASSPP